VSNARDDSGARPLSDSDAEVLFADLSAAPAVVLAVSGGPDSTALLVLAARWRKRRRKGPELLAVTVDHGLRKEAANEAAAVKRLARALGVTHRTVKWKGGKPSAGIQEKARLARYELLMKEAARAGATHLLTAHTCDDQAETVLFRLARGSGIAGLGAMARITPLGGGALVRPFLDLPKARLVATLKARKIAFAEDPSNADPKYTRVRWRALMPGLAQEGLHAARLAALATRMRRANAAIDTLVDAVAHRIAVTAPATLSIDTALYAELPEEVALRLIGRAIGAVGNEGTVELGKLESLVSALSEAVDAGVRFRRTLAGAMVTSGHDRITVERSPMRRNRGGNRPKSPQKTRHGE
jgi:tRNA(Ile)-lysidine synthase